jgi:flagellar hook-associated protein 3 FlgL
MTGIRVRIDQDIARQSALAAKIARGQTAVSTQMRLTAASDDPAAASRIAQLRQTQSAQAGWSSNVGAAIALAASADSGLSNLAALFDRARELAVNAGSDALSNADRNTIALELRAIADEADSLSSATDATGAPVFPATPLRLPVGPALTVAATTSRSAAFMVGARDMGTLLRDAAGQIAAGGPARATALTDITTATEQIATVRGEQGNRAARLDTLRDRMIDSAASIAEERSTLEDADLAATIARVQADQLALDAARASFARINRRTLFDLLA